MRLDKFLKISRLIKRRTVANELCAAGGVRINGKTAKPSSEVKVGDKLVIELGARQLTVEIREVPQKAVPAQSAELLYTVIADVYNKPNPVES